MTVMSKIAIICPHHPRCPGCPSIKQDYPAQLLAKRQLVYGDLKGFWRKPWGKLDSLLGPVVPSPVSEGYRTVGKFVLTQAKDGTHQWGIFEEGTHELVSTPHCLVILPALRDLLNKISTVPVAFRRGRVKFVSLRRCLRSGGQGVVLSHDGVPKEDLLLWIAGWGLDDKTAIYESRLREKDGRRIISDESSHLAGPVFMTWEMLGHQFRVTPLAFFQANGLLGELLAGAVVGLQGEGEAGTLLDLYGGFGGFSLPLAQRFKEIHLVDANRECIAAAREAKGRYGPVHLNAAATTGEDFLKNRLSDGARTEITHVIVNPPRDGLSEKLIELLAEARLAGLKYMTYVSCHPGTLARDLGRLGAVFEFVVDHVKAYDMFPQTRHVETVVRLRFSGWTKAGS